MHILFEPSDTEKERSVSVGARNRMKRCINNKMLNLWYDYDTSPIKLPAKKIKMS